jgi:hypothetical protein
MKKNRSSLSKKRNFLRKYSKIHNIGPRNAYVKYYLRLIYLTKVRPNRPKTIFCLLAERSSRKWRVRSRTIIKYTMQLRMYMHTAASELNLVELHQWKNINIFDNEQILILQVCKAQIDDGEVATPVPAKKCEYVFQENESFCAGIQK